MTGPLFVADPPDARSAVLLESLVAIFHRPSGMTHLLAPPAPELLAALAEGPADADTLLARLARHHDVTGDGPSDGLGEAVRARLAELEAVGLVRRA